VAASSYCNRSARLKDLLVYLTERVLEHEGVEIHEQEVGHEVFGRPADYDTAADNIVRVHASMLRKRLDQYFAAEGASEAMVLEIPKGNYAPVFRERSALVETPPPPGDSVPERRRSDWRLLAAVATALLFAASTLVLALRVPAKPGASGTEGRRFWAQVFAADRPTDIVLDDAGVALYQELTRHPLSLTEYYDHSYLRGIPEVAAAAGLDPQAATSIAMRRVSSYADTGVLSRLLEFAGGRRANLRFARDYSFRDLKANNAILLGYGSSNPWMQSFDAKLGIRWRFDANAGVYYPVDTWKGNRSYLSAQAGAGHESYFSLALVPNLGATGSVLLLSATGGSAVNAAADFLADESGLAQLRQSLPHTRTAGFPPFEALVNAKTRGSQPRDARIVFCRPAAP
jgi:hypothetical protein